MPYREQDDGGDDEDHDGGRAGAGAGAAGGRAPRQQGGGGGGGRNATRAGARPAPPPAAPRSDRRVSLVLSGVRGMAEVLKAAKPTSKHVATVHVAEEGLVMQWEDDAKTMQSSVTFFAQLFSEYERPEGDRDVCFRLPLAQLAEVLGAFAAASSAADDDGGGGGNGPNGGAAAADTAPLVMTYPGPEGELVLELRDEGRAPDSASSGPRRRRCTVLTYARVATLGGGGGGYGGGGGGGGIGFDDDEDEDEGQADGATPLLMDGDWEEPTSYFIAAHQAHMLKEAADDLEWPAAASGASSSAAGGAAAGWGRLTLGRDPPTLSLSAAVGSGTGGGGGGPGGPGGGGERSVEISVPVDDLAAFSCAGPEASFAYPLRALRAALGHVPTGAAAAFGGGGGGGGFERGGGYGGDRGGGGGPNQHPGANQLPPAAAVEYTKVRVDARGLLSVAHMLKVAGGGGGGAGGRRGGNSNGNGNDPPLGPTQMASGRAGGALVHYVVQPLAEEADDYGGGGEGAF